VTLTVAEWVEVTEQLPMCQDRETLIDLVDNSYNGHRLTDPLTIDLGHHVTGLIQTIRARIALDRFREYQGAALR
jgi:hypothetical protein